ncbi:MAG: polysaccharide biosynthesis C-terminal domain-containing protein [Bacteroidota bacterium]
MAKRSIFDLIKQSGLYALGNVAIKLSGLFLAPLYLNSSILSVKAYGQFATLFVFAQICIIVAGLGLGNGLLRYVGRDERAGEQEALPFTAVVASIGFAGLFWLILQFFAEPLASYFLDDTGAGHVILFLGIYIGCKVIAAVPMMLLRIQERPGVYVLVIMLEMVVLIGGVYVFLAAQQRGIEGIYMAYACASGLQVFVLLVALLSSIKWQFKVGLLRPLLAYGGPLIFMGLAGLVLNAGDRFLLKELASDETVAMYEWAARLSGVLNLFVVQSFQLAFTILGLKTLGSGDLSLHRRAFRHFSIWAAWFVLGIALLAFDLTAALGRIGVDAYYLESTILVFPLALGAMLYGVFVVINNIFFATNKTHLISWMVSIAAVLNVLLNLALIPTTGAYGAAAATVLSYGILVFLANRLAGKEIDIQYRWSTFAIVLGIVTCLFVLGLLTQEFALVPRIFARVLLILTYFPLLFLFRLYSRDEIAQGWQFIKEKIGWT